MKLPDYGEITTRMVSDTLKIPMPTLGQWCQNEQFKRAGVAQTNGTRWTWNKTRLLYWMVCMSPNVDYKRAIKEHAELPTKEHACRELGVEL